MLLSGNEEMSIFSSNSGSKFESQKKTIFVNAVILCLFLLQEIKKNVTDYETWAVGHLVYAM